jgi:hypothetical protein
LRQDEAHLAWVRTLPCIAAGDTTPCIGSVQAHHVRERTGGGMGLKPPSQWCIPICAGHHSELHTSGARTFERKYDVSCREIAERISVLGEKLRGSDISVKIQRDSE